MCDWLRIAGFVHEQQANMVRIRRNTDVIDQLGVEVTKNIELTGVAAVVLESTVAVNPKCG